MIARQLAKRTLRAHQSIVDIAGQLGEHFDIKEELGKLNSHKFTQSKSDEVRMFQSEALVGLLQAVLDQVKQREKEAAGGREPEESKQPDTQEQDTDKAKTPRKKA